MWLGSKIQLGEKWYNVKKVKKNILYSSVDLKYQQDLVV